MRAREFIIEDYKDARIVFSREADPEEVRTVIDQYKQLVNKNQFRDPREKNIDYWRAQGWTKFSQMVKLKSSDITDTQRKRGKTVGNAIILQDDSAWTVIIPLDKEASVHYGKATEWCTTKPFQLEFESYFYQRNIALIYAIPKDTASNQHVAIALSPTGDVEMFNRADDTIDAQQYTQISGLDPNKFIAMAKESTNQQQMKSQREKYDRAIEDTKRLLQETPLDPDAIERALKFTKNFKDCYDYIVAYGQEQNKQVAVHPSILVAASANIGYRPHVAEKIGQYIDFSKIPMGVFKSILASNPNIFTYNYKLLNKEQRSLFVTTPASAFNYAKHILGRTRFPEGEAAIATNAEYSYEYAQMLNESFPLGEAAIATSAIYSLMYAQMLNESFPLGEAAIATNAEYSLLYATMLDKPFPAGEAAIAKDARYSYSYAMMLGKRFPAGEAAIAKDPYYNNRYIEDIINSSPDNTLHNSTDQLLSLPSNIDRNNVRDVF